jgi:hypothetical protein
VGTRIDESVPHQASHPHRTKSIENTHGEGGNKSAPNQQNEILTAPDMDGSKKMVRRNYSSHQPIKTKQMSSERSEQGKSRTDEGVRDLTVERNQR